MIRVLPRFLIVVVLTFFYPHILPTASDVQPLAGSDRMGAARATAVVWRRLITKMFYYAE